MQLEAIKDWKDLYSPNYPEKYYDNAHCDWLIRSSSIYTTVEVIELELENVFDTLTIYDGISSNSPVLVILSGTVNTPTVVTSSSKYLYALFTTDYATARKGFHLQYKSMYCFLILLAIASEAVVHSKLSRNFMKIRLE